MSLKGSKTEQNLKDATCISWPKLTSKDTMTLPLYFAQQRKARPGMHMVISRQIQAFKSGARLSAGIDHKNYQVEISPVMENIHNSLLGDLD